MGLFSYARQISRTVYSCKFPQRNFCNKPTLAFPLISSISHNFLISTPHGLKAVNLIGSSIVGLADEDEEEQAVGSNMLGVWLAH